MEPVSATIATALALGASAALKSTAESAVKDAYEALKKLVKDRYAAATVDTLEKMPESLHRRAAVQEELQATPAVEDAEVLQKVRELLDAVASRSPQDAAALGVDLAHVQAEAIRISNVTAQGGGVRVSNAEVSGPIEISHVSAGGAEGSKKKT